MAAVFAILARADCLRAYTGGAYLSLDWLKPFFRPPVPADERQAELDAYLTKFENIAKT